MKQLLQDVSTGELTVEDVPPPIRGAAALLVATRFSLISPGTERAVLELGQASLLGKARARPDLVAKVVDSVRTEGLGPTYARVRGQMAEPNALGYSLCGEVLEACEGAPAAPGELVACAGAGRASHAELVSVPRNLCARVPDGVTPEDAAYATLGAIALHGVRLAEVGLGDVVAVVGLGLVGQLTVELLAAAGCVPLGCDLEPGRVELARAAGAFATTAPAELESEARRLTARRGADAVIVTAASRDSEPLSLATSVARERAVISIVGDVKIESSRAPLFAKELRLVVSRSYGPGRYDPVYEEGGVDYPAGYVRWTEGRNLAEVMRLMARGSLRPSRLTTHTFDLDDGPAAYSLLSSSEPSLGILLRYSPASADGRSGAVVIGGSSRRIRMVRGRLRIGVIGAGAFARGVLMPPLARRATIVGVANATGVSARAAAARFGASRATTDARELLEADDVDAVVIGTRHDSHARYAAAALAAGKHVFVEKPLALDEEELRRVEDAAASTDSVLMVGFNRRFAPFAVRLREELGGRGPLLVTLRVAAGRLPATHWTHDLAVGGGRIVGEGCHFVDLADFLCGGVPAVIGAAAVAGASEPLEDDVTATLRYSDGSVAVLIYAALGDPGLPKERIEVLGEHGAGVLDDFRELTLYRSGSARTNSSTRDKGHRAEIETFLAACREGRQPWPVQEMAAVTRITFEIRDRLLS